MNGYREIHPSPALAPYVDAFWAWQDGTDGANRVLPDGCVDVIFSLHRGPTTDASRLFAVGAMTRPLVYSRRGVPLLLGVRFRPGRAASFLGCPAAEITDLSPPLDDLWGVGATTLHDRLLEAPSLDERLRVLESTLVRRLARRPQPDLLAAAAVDRVRERPAAVATLAADLGISPRQLRRRFLAAVGLGPKSFAAIVRFQSALAAMLSPENEGDGWADLALDAGYYDQAHMTNDFRRWTGLAPGRYLAERSRS